MSVLSDPRVELIYCGYRVINDQAGPVRVYRSPAGGWACFFDWSSPDDLRPAYGFHGSARDSAEQAIEYALTVEEARV